jgi:hypothetical protein
LKQNAAEKQQNLQKIETQLCSQEFELSEIEAEKQVSLKDTKTRQALKELRQRCRGFAG